MKEITVFTHGRPEETTKALAVLLARAAAAGIATSPPSARWFRRRG